MFFKLKIMCIFDPLRTTINYRLFHEKKEINLHFYGIKHEGEITHHPC